MKIHVFFSFCIIVSSLLITSTASARTGIAIDGSSTVFPITEAVIEDFSKIEPTARIGLSMSGSGGGFYRLVTGKTDISNASRKMMPFEIKIAKKKGIKYVSFEIAYDGIVVAVNKKNTWVSSLSVTDLNKIWQSGSKITTWKQVNSNFPNLAIKLYGPGSASGTFEYFTKAINGASFSSRADFTKSKDDNVLIRGVESDEGALGYFGYSYYINNKDRLKLVAISYDKNKSVIPSEETIANGKYSLLSRPLYIYVNITKLKNNKLLQKFVRFYLDNARRLSQEMGSIALSNENYIKSKQQLEAILK